VLRCRIQVKYIVITRRGVNFLIVFQIDGGNDDDDVNPRRFGRLMRVSAKVKNRNDTKVCKKIVLAVLKLIMKYI
jgi:hypothetical protein